MKPAVLFPKFGGFWTELFFCLDFPSWTLSTWRLRSVWRENDALHMGHWVFFPSWTVSICRFISVFRANEALHCGHLVLLPSWTVSMWRFKSFFLENDARQIVHCVFFPSWTVSICLFKSVLRANEALQFGQGVLFPSWTVSTCLFKSVFLEKKPLHTGHCTFCFGIIGCKAAGFKPGTCWIGNLFCSCCCCRFLLKYAWQTGHWVLPRPVLERADLKQYLDRASMIECN